ncbi:hypothetical protein CIL06_03930 [Pantoea vagans]|uniref:hypothetical protein n=1 Tax=Erwiniaceae TaxID=1903409 RepID=UPI000BAC6AF4|nr:hypothetical protein [Pantoea vagans]PAW34904.1 hypothetical protein CIL06_03930 [Pantoea vagans]
MAKHLSIIQIRYIVGVINRWSENEKLTWDALCDKVSSGIGKRPSRQSLSSHKSVEESFKLKKEQLKHGEDKTIKPANRNAAIQRIKRLEAENKALLKENNGYLEQFHRWQYNAHIRQITLEDLDSPLPKKYGDKFDRF